MKMCFTNQMRYTKIILLFFNKIFILRHFEHSRVVELIRNTGSSVKLGVVISQQLEEADFGIGDLYEVIIQRGPSGSFGFGLRGGSEYGMRLYVLRLAPGE